MIFYCSIASPSIEVPGDPRQFDPGGAYAGRVGRGQDRWTGARAGVRHSRWDAAAQVFNCPLPTGPAHCTSVRYHFSSLFPSNLTHHSRSALPPPPPSPPRPSVIHPHIHPARAHSMTAPLFSCFQDHLSCAVIQLLAFCAIVQALLTETLIYQHQTPRRTQSSISRKSLPCFTGAAPLLLTHFWPWCLHAILRHASNRRSINQASSANVSPSVTVPHSLVCSASPTVAYPSHFISSTQLLRTAQSILTLAQLPVTRRSHPPSLRLSRDVPLPLRTKSCLHHNLTGLFPLWTT